MFLKGIFHSTDSGRLTTHFLETEPLVFQLHFWGVYPPPLDTGVRQSWLPDHHLTHIRYQNISTLYKDKVRGLCLGVRVDFVVELLQLKNSTLDTEESKAF